MELRTIKTALISVSEKSNLTALTAALAIRPVKLISTGGTHAAITQLGLPVTKISEVTGSPEVMGGRVKTIHPRIAGGILFRREETEDWYALGQLGGTPIDLVVVNLYPFQEKLRQPGITDAELIENIDIGGPSLIRAAAKNHRDVVVITSPSDYQSLITHLDSFDGQTHLEYRRELAAKAFALTQAYDQAIANYFEHGIPD